MMSEQSLFNSSVSHNYHIDNTTMHFSFFLNPIRLMIEHQFKNHFVYAEDFMFKIFEEHNSTLEAREWKDLLAHLPIPIIYAYVLFGGILISVLAIPYICCFGSCTKKNIDSSKYQCCFPTEVMLFVLFIISLLIGVICAYQITVQIQDVLMTFPLMWRNMLQDLLTNINIFKIQVHSLVSNVENSFNSIKAKTAGIPNNITGLFKQILFLKLDEDIFKVHLQVIQTKVMFDKSGFVINKDSVEHLVEVATNTVKDKIENVYNILLQQNFTGHYTMFNLTEKFANKKIVFPDLQFPNWNIIYRDWQMVFDELLPAANKSLFFMDDLFVKVKNYSHNELRTVATATRKLQELSTLVDANITRAIEKLLPNEKKEFIVNATYKIDHYLSSLPVSRNYMGARFSNGNMWIMLIPTMYALIVLLILIMAFIAAARDLKRIIATVGLTSPSLGANWALRLFRISMVFSVSFLWLTIILTAIFYCAHLPLSVFCEAIKDQRIFSEYLDNPNVWNNKTWLNYKLDNYLPKHGDSLKMREILDKCYRNESLYIILNMHEYWNVSQHIDALNITANMDVLHRATVKAVEQIKFPDASMIALTDKLATIQTNLDMRFVPLITNNVQKFYNNNIEEAIAKVFEFPGDVTTQNRSIKEKILQQLLDDVKRIKYEHIPCVLRNITELVDLKYYLKNLEDEIIRASSLMSHLWQFIQQNSSVTISTFLNSTVRNINTIITEVRTSVQRSIEKEIGNCYVLPFLYDKATWSICDYGLPLISGAWITMGLISISIAVCMIFSCRLSGYIRGSKEHYCIWRQQLESQRYSSQTARLNRILLFDRMGNLISRPFRTKKSTQDKAT